MPLTWLGQLSPTMQQQIALQRALLALQREDEQIRMKTMPQTEQPALARGLQGGGTVKPYAGPTSSFAEEPAFKGGMEYSPVTREPLARALVPATEGAPVTGRPDWQAEAWARRKEIVKERVVGAKEAYDRIVTLDPNGQKVALSALRRYKREVYNAMEKEGYLSPAGELVQPAKEKTLMLQRIDSYSGEVINVYADGSEEGTGRFEKLPEPEVKGLTPTEQLNILKFQFDVEKAGPLYVTQAIKDAGGVIAEGDMIRRPGENNYRAATKEDVERRYKKIEEHAAYLRVQAAGISTIEDVKIAFQHNPEAIRNAQRNMPGALVDGVWTDAVGQFLYDTFYKEE